MKQFIAIPDTILTAMYRCVKEVSDKEHYLKVLPSF